jgi:hypothetical protein
MARTLRNGTTIQLAAQPYGINGLESVLGFPRKGL